MRIVFVGTVEGSKYAFQAVVRAGFVPVLVITLPKMAAHRHSDFVDLTVDAECAGSTVFYATDVNALDTLEAIKSAKPDFCMVFGWSQICHKPFRSIARVGNIGFHPSALPKLRGRAVIPWTILLNLKETGSTIFWLDDAVDSGPILLQKVFPVSPGETARSLYLKHRSMLTSMVPEALTLLQSDAPPQIYQDHQKATYCAKRTLEDGLIDWRLPASEILKLIRAVGDPYPGAFTYQKEKILFIDEAMILPNSNQYVGLVGQVQCYTDGGFAVRCGDGHCIDVRKWRSGSTSMPKLHSKFVS